MSENEPDRRFSDLHADWQKLVKEIRQRQKVVKFAIETHGGDLAGDARKAAAFELASVDVFVEKAQDKLDRRAIEYRGYGNGLFFLTTATLIGSIVYLSLKDVAANASELANTNSAIAVFVMHSLALSGFVLALIYFLASLTRAFLHEATILHNRIHAVRFGRLFVYLKFGGTSDPGILDQIRKELRVSELEEAFGWNIETSTAFKDIKAELMGKSIVSQILERVDQIYSARGGRGREGDK